MSKDKKKKKFSLDSKEEQWQVTLVLGDDFV
jgi:hypothetical protein